MSASGERERERKRLKRSNPTKSGDTRRVVSIIPAPQHPSTPALSHPMLCYALVKIALEDWKGGKGNYNNVIKKHRIRREFKEARLIKHSILLSF